MDPRVRFHRRGRVAIVTVDNPPVNALSRGVPRGVIEALEEGATDPGIVALVLVGAGRTFIAGADIREFGQPRDPEEPDLRDMIAAIERCPKPVVAAMHGTALGGGLEAALGCHWRVGTASSHYGFPEVRIGLLPGAGGTQRAPRLIGVKAALEMCLSGDFVSSARALELGLIDAEVPADLVAGAATFAEKKAQEPDALRRVRDMKVDTAGLSADFFDEWRRKIAPKTRGLLSPSLIVDCIEIATKTEIDEGLKEERKLFERCLESPQSKALIHVFFAERAAAKVHGITRDTPVHDIHHGAVVGAGTMGHGIAMCFANAGIPVVLMDNAREALERGTAAIRSSYQRAVERGRLTPEEMGERLGRIEQGLALEAVREADIVVEAVVEDLALKRELFAKLSRLCRPNAIFATNTSTLSVNAIAAAAARPERVIGTHFFSPAHVMRLIETVRGAKTAPETVATVMALARRLGKLPVVVGVCPGFVGNRMLYAYQRQAFFLVEEGALPEQVDGALTAFGLAMGPFAMNDMAGLDVGYRARKADVARHPQGWRYSRIADLLCEMGRLGQKSGKGWYRYEEGSRKPQPDPEVVALIEAESKALKLKRRAVPDEEIVERCLHALVNEGAKILEEGIAERASDIDLIWINGYGFPAWRGGPMFYADSLGLDRVYEAVRQLSEQYGEWWEPAPLLQQLAEAGRKFNE